jgi:hypothetical protein
MKPQILIKLSIEESGKYLRFLENKKRIRCYVEEMIIKGASSDSIKDYLEYEGISNPNIKDWEYRI